MFGFEETKLFSRKFFSYLLIVDSIICSIVSIDKMNQCFELLVQDFSSEPMKMLRHTITLLVDNRERTRSEFISL